MELINRPGPISMEFIGQRIVIGDMWYMNTTKTDNYYSSTGDDLVDMLTNDLRWGYPSPNAFYSILNNGTPFNIIKWFQTKYPDGLPTSTVFHYFNVDGEIVPQTQQEKDTVGLTLSINYVNNKAYFLGRIGYFDSFSEYLINYLISAQSGSLNYLGADINNLTEEDYTAATLWFYKPQMSYMPDGTNGLQDNGTQTPASVDNKIYIFLNGEIVNLAKEYAGESYNNLYEVLTGQPIQVQFPNNRPDSPYFQIPSIVNYGSYDVWGNPLSIGTANDYRALYKYYTGGAKFAWFNTEKLPQGEIIIQPEDFKDYNNDPDPEEPDEPDTTGGHGNYKPSEESIPPDEVIIPPSIISKSGCAHLYLPTSAQTQSFYKELWDQDLIDYLKNMFTNNPMDCVISLACFPMDFDALGYRSADTVKCVVGDREMNTQMFYANNDFVGVDFGTITLRERWGSAVDYEPFTRMQLFLPFIGFVDISPNDVYVSENVIKEARKEGRPFTSTVGYIHLRYMINLFTGDCVAYVFGYGNALEETLIGTYTGVCGMQIPITGRDYNSFFSSVAGGLLKSVGSALSGSIGAAAGDLVTTAISATGGPPVQRSGSFTAGTSLIGALEPFLIRTTPQQDLPNFAGYKKVVGLPYNKYVTLTNISGYVEIEDVKASGFSGTDEELNEFLELAKGGIWFEITRY